VNRLFFALAVVALAGVARADHVYLVEADAPRAIFPESTGAEAHDLDLGDAELRALEKILGKRVEVRRYRYLDVVRGEAAVGRIFFLDVVGQSKLIGFGVGVTPDAELKDVEVMVYRETQGEQIREARFRRQFAGKKLEDPIALGKDIDAVSGATISSRSAAYAGRKALALEEILRARMPDRRLGALRR
jgi:Na+-translocating ferredoxin:NAD+ oxidoreductase RnfG subunit